MIDAIDLAQMRADQAEGFPSTCTIQAPTETTDALGAKVKSYSNTYTSIACRMSPMSQQDAVAILGEQYGRYSSWWLTVAYNQTIAPGYRVVFGGDTFDVVTVIDDHDWRTARRVVVVRKD